MMQGKDYPLGNLIQIKYIYFSIIHAVFSIIADSFIFEPSRVYNSLEYFIIKSFAILFILIFWQGIGYIYTQIRDKNQFYISYIKHFFIYFGTMVFFLVLVWPGIWRSDDIGVFTHAKMLEFEYWQHFLTSVVHIFSLMIIPFPVGIVVMQLFFISLIVAYIITKCGTFIANKRLINLMYIPFFLPSIIDSNLFPLRVSIYSFLVLLFLFSLTFKHIEKNKVNWFDVFFWGLLIVIISVWRSETVYFCVIAPFVIKLLFRNKIGFMNLLFILIISMLGTGILNSIQNHGLEKTTNDTYKFTAVAEPLGALMKADLKGNNIDRHLINIDKVVNVEILRNYNGMEALFYRDGLRKNYSNDDYNNFIKSYVYLSLNNLDTFIANRLEFFAEASGFKETPNSMILNSSELFKLVPPYDQNPLYSEFINEPFNKPIFSKLRENVIKILELRRIDNYYVTTPLYHFFYNVLPSLLLLICFVLYYLFKKEWGLACLLTLILGTFPLILFTAPAPYFMYYIPLLLCGYSYAVFFMIMLRRKTV